MVYLYQDKKAEENFKQLADLILNYDKKDDPNPSEKPFGKLSKRGPRKRIKTTPTLQTVEERDDELEETNMQEEFESRLN